MKNIKYYLMVIVGSLLSFAGCQPAQSQQAIPFTGGVSFIPEGSYALGFAPVEQGGIVSAETKATEDALYEFERRMNISIRTIIKNIAETIGVDDEQTINNVCTAVSGETAEAIRLSGSYKKKTHFDQPTNTLYVFFILNNESLSVTAESIKNRCLTTMKKETAFWKTFQATNGRRELEEQITREFDIH